jgi:hypothetical protein
MNPAVLVLAGRRSATPDPLAVAAAVSHKALVPVKGEAMVGRVLRIAEAAFPGAPLYVSVDDFPAIAGEPTVARLVAAGRLAPLEARPNIVESVVEASRTTGFPLLITTADNVLMTPEGMRSIHEEGIRTGADAVAMMAEKKGILAANLFWLGSARSLQATESFRLGGQFAKHKRRAVKALGLTTLLLYVSRLLTLEGMFRHFSRRFGIVLRPLVARDGRLAIDVDNERTHRVAEEILTRETAA